MNQTLSLLIIIVALLLLAIIPYFGLVHFSKDAKEKNKLTTKQLMYIVILTTLATVIGFIEIPLGTIIPGGKLDFSEVIILIALLVLGYKHTLVVIFLRSFIRLFLIPNELDFIMKSLGEGIAILASVIIITAYLISTALLRTNKKPLMYAVDIDECNVSILERIIIPLITTLMLVSILFVFHYFVTVPFYGHLFGLEIDTFNKRLVMITTFTILNIIKGVLSPTIFLLVRNQLQKVVK